MRILYLEDDPADAHMVERYVRLGPHAMQVVNTTEDAIATLENPPDLFLVDILLNHVREGFDFVRQLRTQGYTQPIIAITGLALPNEVEQCYAAGSTDVLTKPYTIQQLAEILDKYLVSTGNKP